MQSFAIWSLEGLGYRCWPSKYRAFWVLSVQSTYTWGHQQWTAASYIGGLCNSFRSCEILESFSYKRFADCSSCLNYGSDFKYLMSTAKLPTSKQMLQKIASYKWANTSKNCILLSPFKALRNGNRRLWICLLDMNMLEENLTKLTEPEWENTEQDRRQQKSLLGQVIYWVSSLQLRLLHSCSDTKLEIWRESIFCYCNITFLTNGPKSQDRVCVEKQREMWCTALIFNFFL